MYRLLLLILLLSTHNLIAQSIKGVVLDETGNPLSAATVSLLRAKDSTPQKLEVTDAQGRFSITISKEESYLLCASSVGYTKACSGTLILTQASSEQIKLQLEKQSTALRGVTVSARRPLVEVKADKMVVNVEGTINSIGTTALEVLRKAPGVNLDNDDNISISGKSGVQVYIDGRLSPLSGTDLSGYLSSLQSAQIEAIEIITNPSARYEAAGNGGIINIRLKKNKAFGTNGSVNAGYGIGRYSKYNGGFSLNYRNRWFNIFSTYTYANNRNLISTRTYRILADTIFDQKAKRVVTDKPHNIQAGVDYFINQKSVLGFLVNALPGRIVFDNTSTTPIQPVGATTPYRTLEAAGLNKNKRTNTSMNLNYRFSTTDREFNADADYAHYQNTSNQFQPNYYYDNNNTFLFSRIYRMVSPSDISMHSLKMNYDFPMNKGKWSVGGKWGQVESDNHLARFDVLGNSEKMDSLRSNDFRYKENINALFVRFTKEYKNKLLQIGLRGEQTAVNGYSQGYRYSGGFYTYDSSFSRTYTNLFPSASLTFKKSRVSQWSINMGRRIDRPAYQDLNPFEYKVDEYVYRRGNTALKPQYTTSMEAVHIFREKLTSVLSYSRVSDVFTQIFDTAEITRTFITKTNVSTQDVVNLSINYVIQQKRYSGFININPSYNNYRASFGKGRELHLEAFSYTLKSQHGYRFDKGFAAELSLLYNSPGIGLGFFEGRPFGSVDIAVSKTALNNKLSLKAAMSDLFFTNKLGGTSLFAGQYMDVERSFEPRLFRINASYRFGSNTVKGARQRKTLLDEENRRLQSSN